MDIQEKMVLITAVMTYSASVFMVSAKPVLGRLFFKLFGAEQISFWHTVLRQISSVMPGPVYL